MRSPCWHLCVGQSVKSLLPFRRENWGAPAIRRPRRPSAQVRSGPCRTTASSMSSPPLLLPLDRRPDPAAGNACWKDLRARMTHRALLTAASGTGQPDQVAGRPGLVVRAHVIDRRLLLIDQLVADQWICPKRWPLRRGLAVATALAVEERSGGSPAALASISHADVAQLVEHFTRNEGVRGSSPRVGFARCPAAQEIDKTYARTGKWLPICRRACRLYATQRTAGQLRPGRHAAGKLAHSAGSLR